MNRKPVYLFLLFVVLVCVLGLSQSSAQRNARKKRGAAAAKSPSPSPTASPSATPVPTPATVLTKIQDTIKRYENGNDAGAFETTKDFKFTCAADCKNCTLEWDFYITEQNGNQSKPFHVSVPLNTIDPKRVFVQGPQVRFTTDGQAVSVTIPANQERAKKAVNGQLQDDPNGRMEYTSSWRISVRNEEGAEKVAKYLKQVLSEPCKSP